MDRRGVKRRRVHRNSTPRPIRTRRLSARPPCPPASPPESPWGKNPARRGGRGIFPPGQNFQRPGGGEQGIPAGASLTARAPKRPLISLPKAAQNLRGLRISAAVFRLWQE